MTIFIFTQVKANASTQTFSPEESLRFAEENNKMIDVVKEMIENHEVLFDVSVILKSIFIIISLPGELEKTWGVCRIVASD